MTTLNNNVTLTEAELKAIKQAECDAKRAARAAKKAAKKAKEQAKKDDAMNKEQQMKQQEELIREVINMAETAGRICEEGEDRNEVLKHIVDDNKVYRITFAIDSYTEYDKVSKTDTAVVGCKCVVIFIDGVKHVLKHTWLKEKYVPQIKDYNHADIGAVYYMDVKVKSYDANDSKYEFTTIF